MRTLTDAVVFAHDVNRLAGLPLQTFNGFQVLDYLDHKILAAGVLSIPSHMSTIQELPCPSIIKELQAVLGMVNFYRVFRSSV